MKRLLSSQTSPACRAGVLGCVLLAVMSCAALAQTTGAVSPKPAPAEPPVKEEPAPGGCMPVGVTASGEIVFPFQCKEFIELHRAANRQPAAEENQPTTPDQKPDAAEEKTLAKQSAVTEKPTIAEVKPAAAEEKPVTAEKKPAAAETETTARQEESVAPENSKPATEPVGPVPLPRRVERERVVGPPGCPNFRTYDPASGTYRTFDGQRHQCRAVVGQSFRK
jgi:BA14K-like protein